MVTTKLMTAEELERLPDDDKRYELLEGELVAMAAVKPRHFRILGNVHAP